MSAVHTPATAKRAGAAAMTTSISPASLDSLARTLAGTWPPDTQDDPLAAARAALEDLAPCDLIEVTLAARIIATHHAEVDSYRRAMQPGLSPADITRLRSNAVAVGRASDAAVRALAKRRAPAKEPEPLPAAARRRAAAPAPVDPVQAALDQFTPEEIAAAEISLDNDPADLARSELAKRIPLDRFEDMTMEERRIAYAPRALMTPPEIAVMGARIAAANRLRKTGNG
jgi:hypothetical protein